MRSAEDSAGAPASRTPRGSWLRFVDACQVAVGRCQIDGAGPVEEVSSALRRAAGQLESHAERLLGAAVVSQIDERIRAQQFLRGATADEPGSLRTNLGDIVLAATASVSPIGPTTDSRVLSVLRYVESEHLHRTCRLDAVAAQLRMSRTHLSRLVLRETGRTFRHLLQVRRMESAAELLIHTRMSIKEIASETGYEHAASFDRKFGRHFHLTPGQFRRQRSRSVVADPKRDALKEPTS